MPTQTDWLGILAPLQSAAGVWLAAAAAVLCGWQVLQAGLQAGTSADRSAAALLATLLWTMALALSIHAGLGFGLHGTGADEVAWGWPLLPGAAAAAALAASWSGATRWRAGAAGLAGLAGTALFIGRTATPLGFMSVLLAAAALIMLLAYALLRAPRSPAATMRWQPGLWALAAPLVVAVVAAVGALPGPIAAPALPHWNELPWPQQWFGLCALTLLYIGVCGIRRTQAQAATLDALQQRFDLAPDGLLVLDAEHRITAANAAALRLLALRPEEATGKTLPTLLDAADTDLGEWLRDPASSPAGPGERRALRPLAGGGALALRLARAGLGVDRQGRDAACIVTLADISAQHAEEEAIRQRERRYRGLIDNIPGVSFSTLLDEPHTTLFASPSVDALTGWPASDFTSGRRTLAHLIHPSDRQRIQQALILAAGLPEGGPVTAEFRLLHRSESERWVWFTGQVTHPREGGPPRLDGVLLDITETRRHHWMQGGTAEAVQRVMGVAVFAMDGRIEWANDRMLGWMGYTLEEFTARHHHDLVDAAAGRQTAFDALWQRLRRGEFEVGEYRRVTRQGQEFWLQGSYNPIFDADGIVVRVVLLAQDINPRRQMEGALREAKARAEQAAAARTMFLANMSHEIRTPMNAILGFTELLLEGPLAVEQRRHLQTVRQSAQSLLGLLNGILDTAKLDRGALELELADFSLRELLEQTATSLRLEAERKGLALQVLWDDALDMHFRADAVRIRQVLTNLLGNAIKFTERGEVRLAARRAGDLVELSVQDTGIGIPADRLAAIFDPFAQADASTSRRFGGTGLGTTIARQLTELMGGRIEVQSTPGQGSVFRVLLPLKTALAPAPLPRLPEPPVEPPPLSVLAVDDVPENRDLVRLALGQRGHQVSTAADAPKALDLLMKHRFHVVLLDVHMPGIDGLEAARRIRAYEASRSLPPTPLIALSASVLPADRQAARTAGMEGFVPKPFEAAQLLAEMARVTGLQRGGDLALPMPAAAPAGTMLPAGVDWARGIRNWTHEAALRRALDKMLAQHGGAAAAIAEQVERGQLDEARQIAHRLRGLAGNLACDELFAAATNVELALAQGEPDAARQGIPALSAAFDAVQAALDSRPLPPSTPDGERVMLDGARLRTALAELLRAIHRNEMAGDEDWPDVAATLAFMGEGPTADALRQALDGFEFGAAARLLESLIDRLPPDAALAGEKASHP
ncbi:PAS domain S-box-containing protein [Pseudacidovorax sp. 1753]|uniref:hybrid sensor histidine kinase/response regulator n=1 Tax=unclassified Pseudacidovorax TaxID=2620592 RepID=UPI001B5CAC68|nr:hybrid sensor histidine kinase/response regulator [Pseudacidovorax sp.]MBP6896058.1 PAS domain-containing protein [Pseudacidovorax sp.]